MLRALVHCGLMLVALFSAPMLQAADDEIIAPTRIENVRVRDGVNIAVAIYLPKDSGRYPTLFAASPYRFDNNLLPPTPQFLWRETGPIKWYLDHGYAFVHMDVRGTGRSDGEYRFLDSKEQTDFYDVIEWVAQQPWSDGKIGGIGQSYYAMTQWFMAAQKPPHLACIAPYDGLIDAYTGIAYSGGIPEQVHQHLVQRRAAAAQPVSLDRSGEDAAVGSRRRSQPASDSTTRSGRSEPPSSSSTRSRYRCSRSESGPRSNCICKATSSATSASMRRRSCWSPVRPTCSRRRPTSTASPSTKNICCRSTTGA